VDDAPGDGSVFETEYADPRAIVNWVLELGDRARLLGPPEVVDLAAERIELIVERHRGTFETAKSKGAPAERPPAEADEAKGDSPIRPERFARLVTLASILIQAAREGTKLDLAPLCEQLNVTEQELQEDIDVLNVVNFGGGSYVVYAEVVGDTIEVDPEPYGDNFARPARLLPLQAKALVAAIDLIGEHIPEGSLESARQKIVDALGQDPSQDGLQITRAKGDDSDVARVLSEGIVRKRVVEIDYYKENEDDFSTRRIEPYQLANGTEGWYVVSFDLDRDDTRTFRLDRIRSATVLDEKFEAREGVEADTGGWLRTGEVEASQVARIWWSPERARWAREDKRVVEELKDGAVVVELAFKGTDWLVHQILSLGGDAVVLEPEEARSAVLEGAEALAGLARS
jgi:proteasome accessory factor C